MPAGVDTGTARSIDELLFLLADYRPANSSNRQLLRDLVESLKGPATYVAGAIGDGQSHPLSTYFATLAVAQATYPHALALTDELDWAAIQLALNNEGAKALASGDFREVVCRQGHYLINRTIAQSANTRFRGAGDGTRLQATLANVNLIAAANVTQVQVEAMWLDGNGIGALGVLYNIATKSSVARCKITGFNGLNVSSYGGGVHMYLCDDAVIRENRCSGNGVLVGGLTSDIQINGNGIAADCTKRVHIIDNDCESTAVQTNIVAYDVAWSEAYGNFCSGAKTQASNNNGYGIIFYRTVNANAGTARRNRIELNMVLSVGGTAIYAQGQDDCVTVGNTCEDWGAVQDDTTLVVGAIGYSNSPRGVISSNEAFNGAKGGVVIGGIAGNCESFVVGLNDLRTITGYAIYLRGPVTRSSIGLNTMKNVACGIGTPPVNQNLDGCSFIGNTVDGTTAQGGYEFYGANRCLFNGNYATAAFRDGVLFTQGGGNTLIGNQMWDGSLAADNTYAAYDVAACPDCVLDANYGGNTGGVGFKYAYFVSSTSPRSKVTNNKAGGARTANFNVDNTLANQIAMFGNFDLALADAQFFAARQQLRLQGAANSITQLLLGDSSVYGAVGTRFSGGDTFIAQNASHTLGSDLWHQSSAGAASKLLILRLNGDCEFYSAPAATGDATFATFWGTAKVALGATGTIKILGTQVLGARSTGWTAQTAVASKADLGAAPTNAALASWASAIQAALTTAGIVGP